MEQLRSRTFKIPEGLDEALVDEAHRRRVSVSALIRDIVQIALATPQNITRPKPPAAAPAVRVATPREQALARADVTPRLKGKS